MPSRVNYKNRCAVSGCVGKNSAEVRMYAIPFEDQEAWCENLGIKTSSIKSESRVCSRHFEANCVGKAKLKKGARPTLHLGIYI